MLLAFQSLSQWLCSILNITSFSSHKVALQWVRVVPDLEQRFDRVMGVTIILSCGPVCMYVVSSPGHSQLFNDTVDTV